MVGQRIQLVCTGNVCRSPALATMLSEGCAGPGWGELGFNVTSAGTRALAGQPMEPRMRRALVELGFRTDDSFVATQLTPASVEASTLILTATTEQRAQVFRVVPSAVPRTFTLREFAARTWTWRPTGASAAERLPAMIMHAAQQRGIRLYRRSADEDISDPYRRSLRAHRRAAVELLELATELTRNLAPPEGS